jgi:hypothetical protein
MKNTGTLQVATSSDREIALTRTFAAPHRLVFEAFTNHETLVRATRLVADRMRDGCEGRRRLWFRVARHLSRNHAARTLRTRRMLKGSKASASA